MLNWKSIQHLNSFQKLFQYVELENYTFLEIVSCYFLRISCDLGHRLKLTLNRSNVDHVRVL
jgi:hypothetical protein